MPGPNPSVDRRVRWMRRAPGWQGAPNGQQAKKISCYKMFILLKNKHFVTMPAGARTHERIVLTG